MSVSITFRHMESTDALKAYAEKKVERLQKFLRQPMTAKVTMALERHEQVVEIQVHSGGESYEAKDVGEDTYASIDKVTDKLESQIRHAHGAENAKRRREPDLRHADWEPVAGSPGDR
jgi:putative sigma-54 modulation protein